jgi:serine/threonine protein kinase
MHTGSGPEDDGEFGQTMRGVVGGTKLFDRFTLQKVLGRGGMGIVWLARDERLDRLVALKLVPETVCFDASAQEDLKRETRKSLMLTHTNIVRIFDFIEDGNTAAISMEYVDGSTLSSLRVKQPAKCFEVGEISGWVSSLCDALTYAHDSAGVIHRDLKPANLMVNSRSELKVTDFGIACTLRESMTCVSVRTSSGTLNYMSPQQLLGEDPSPADDIYALGATIYEMLASKPPFYSGDVASQVRDVVAPTVTQRRTKFAIHGESIPKYWEETIAQCLAKNPEHRPRTPADVARRLRLNGPVRVTTKTRKPLFMLDKRMALIGAVAAAFLVTATILLLHHPGKTEVASNTTKTVNSAKAVEPVGYALEQPIKPLASPPPRQTREPSAAEVYAAVAAAATPTPAPVAKVQSKNATLHLTTTPGGATFSVYPGVIAGKTAPGAMPLKTGSAPDSIEDLPPGRYTLFFHNDGWPDDRAEITVDAGENVPVDYTFPHGSVSVTSVPPGAEIFFAGHSFGQTPLTVDLPLGKQKMVAKYPDMSDRSQTITVTATAETKVAFQMRSTGGHSSRAKATPTPNAIDKIGQSFKHLFGGKTPPPKKKN